MLELRSKLKGPFSVLCSLPSQGVRAGGLVDIIANEETGYLANNNDDMVEFSQRVAELVQDSDLRQRLGSNGLTWAQVLM